MKHSSIYTYTSTPTTVFAILAAASLLFWWGALAETFGLALTNEAYSHLLLILPLSAALVYLDSKTVSIAPHPSRRIGAVVLALAALIGCYARWGMSSAPADVRLCLGMSAVVSWWIASAVFCFGQRFLRSYLFPLLFLFFLVPLPNVVLGPIVGWLQHGSAWMAAVLFRAVGEPVRRDGIFLYLRGLDLEVAEECSSIRSSCLLLITTMVLAHLFLRSWWRNAILVLAVIPLSIAKNGLRIFVIAEVGMHIDRAFLDGWFHHHGGVVFLVIALAAVILLLAILHRGETRPQLLGTSSAQG